MQPGDLLVGDADGVVVVPPELAEDLITDCREQEQRERFITEQVRAGHDIDGLYPLGPDWHEMYERWRKQHSTQGELT